MFFFYAFFQLIETKLYIGFPEFFSWSNLILFGKLLIINSAYFYTLILGILLTFCYQHWDRPRIVKFLILLLLSSIAQSGTILIAIWKYSANFKLCLKPYMIISTYIAVASSIPHSSAYYISIPIISLGLGVLYLLNYLLNITAI